MIPNQSLACAKGTSFTFEIDMETGSDLTGATAQWALAESWFDGAKVFLTKTTETGVFINQENGTWKIIVELAPSDTLNIQSGLLYHDCKVLLQNGDVEDVANGPFLLDPSVNLLNTNAPITRNLRVVQALGGIGQSSALTDGSLSRSLLATQTLESLGQTANIIQGYKYFLAAEGDSITLGTSPLIGGGPYPDHYLGHANVLFDFNDSAVNGSTLANMVSRASAVDALLPSSLTGRVFVLSALIGANDLKDYPGASDAAAAASYTSDLFAYYDARRALGWKMVGATILPRDDSAAHNTRRAIVNSNILSSVGVHCDAVADFASDAQMGADNAKATYPSNWYDGLHPGDNGHIRMEAIYRASVNGLVPVDLPAPPIPAVQADFTTISSLPQNFQFYRSSTATYFDASGNLQIAAIDAPRFDHDPTTHVSIGLLIEEIRTNLFLNSGSPATQTIAISSGSIYTVSFYGTGSIALTGAVSHTMSGAGATSKVEYTFTASSTSLVVTLSGTITYPQVELGGFATSYIPTAGSAATRREDVLQLKRFALAAAMGVAGTVIIQGAFFHITGQARLFNGGSIEGMTLSADGVTWQYYNGSADIVTSPSNDIRAQSVRGCIAWDTVGRSAFATGALNVGSDTTPDPSHSSTWHIGSRPDASDNFINGYIQAFAIYSSRLSDSEIAAKCVVGAAF